MPRASQSSRSSTFSSRPKAEAMAAALSARAWGVALLGGAATSRRASSTPAQVASTFASPASAPWARASRLTLAGSGWGSASLLKR